MTFIRESKARTSLRRAVAAAVATVVVVLTALLTAGPASAETVTPPSCTGAPGPGPRNYNCISMTYNLSPVAPAYRVENIRASLISIPGVVQIGPTVFEVVGTRSNGLPYYDRAMVNNYAELGFQYYDFKPNADFKPGSDVCSRSTYLKQPTSNFACQKLPTITS